MKTIAMWVLVVATAGGCSVALQKRPPATARAGTSCETSRALPTIDVVGGSIGMAGGGGLLTYAWGRNHEAFVLPAGALVFASFVALESALTGYGWASKCEQMDTAAAVAGR